MFQDIVKSDALRRGKSIRPGPGTPSSWMSPASGGGMSPPPAPNTDMMMQILSQAPGMTPELLRQILDQQKNKMAPPVIDPRAIVGAANYRTPL